MSTRDHRSIHLHMNPLFDALKKEMTEDTVNWFGQEVSDNVIIMILGLVGEAGEVADCYKKYLRGTKSRDTMLKEIREEMFDVLYYWTHIAELLDVNVFKEYEAKRSKNEERFGGR